MTAVLSTWFDARYLQDILRCAEKDESIEISNLIIEPATSKGDNYGSELYRITVEISGANSGNNIREKKSVLLKVVPDNDDIKELVVDAGLFNIELSMLSETLPKMNAIIAKLSSTPFSARCLHAQYEKPIHIILEDLTPRGFRMAQRQLGLDLEHSLLAMRNLGRFHATTIALKEKDPTVLKNYERGIYHKNMPTSIRDFFNVNVARFAKELPHWPEINPGIADKLIKLSEVAYEKACATCLWTKDDFIVLNHGDCWINNMMFRYDDQQKPIDLIFVDFQISHWGSPADDILYFIGGSLSYDVRFNYRDLILREYYSSLTNTMKELQCTTEAPSFEELQEILQKRAFCEVLASMIVLPIVTLEKGESIDVSEILGLNTDVKNPALRGVLFKKIMLRLIPLYDSMGFLDV